MTDKPDAPCVDLPTLGGNCPDPQFKQRLSIHEGGIQRTQKAEDAAQISLRVSLRLYAYQDGEGGITKLLLADLKGSTINPGKGMFAEAADRVCGFYTERVDVSMEFRNPKQKIFLIDFSPGSTAVSGSISSSITHDFSGGFFGKEGTLNVGGSISNSFSYDLPDYTVFSNSDAKDGTRLKTTQSLSIVEGKKYTSPKDLAKHPHLGISKLYTLPPKSISDLNLFSQGLWRSTSNIMDVVNFDIEVNATFRASFLNKNSPLHGERIYPTATLQNRWTFPIDFSLAYDTGDN